MARKPNRNPAYAYAQQAAVIETLLGEIREGLNAHAKGETPHWGHVGDLAGYREDLERVRDKLWQRGEYANDGEGEERAPRGQTFDRHGNPIIVSIPND